MAISRQRLRDIYDVISENGYQGDYDSFEAKFSDHDNQNNYQYRLRVFATMRGHGATDAATYEDFMKSLQPQSPQPKTPQAPAQRASQPPRQSAGSKPAANAEQAKADGNSTAPLPPVQQAPTTRQQSQTATWKPTQAQKEEMAAEVQRMTDDAVAGISGGSERVARVVQTVTPEWREQQRLAEQVARMAGADVSRPLGLNPGAAADETADGGKGKATKDSKDTRNIFAPRTSPQVVGHTYDKEGNVQAVWQLGNGDITTDRTQVEIAEFAARQARQADEFAKRMKANGLNPAKAEDIQKQVADDQFDINHADLIKRQTELEAELQELYNRREQEEQKRASKRSWWQEIGHAANEANRNMHPTSSYVEFPIDAAIRDKQAELIKIERTLRRERQAASAADGNWFSNLFKGIGIALTDVDTYTFGAYSASANKRVNDAIKAGGTATEEQKQLLRTAGVAQEQQDHIGGLGIYDTGAFVGGMMASPEMWAGAWAGKAISAPMRKLLFGKASEAVVGRMLPSARLWRRAAMASGSGAANFAAFEGVGNARQQLINGGKFSIGDVVHSTIRGSILGATTGVVGSLIGNVGDKVIKSVNSTPGKAASWLGKHVVSAVAEGTIFAVPQYFDPNNKMDWWDVEAENISMIFGMKLGNKAMGTAKMASAPMKASQRLRSLLKGDGKTTFSQRLRAAIEASPVKLTQEERNELAAYGYGGVEAMLRRRKGDIRDENGRRSVTAAYADDIAGYDAINALMFDSNVSEAARAKVYYIVTGHTLPMHAVMGWNIVENNGRYVVESTGAGNQVITRRVFGSRDAVDAEVDKIRHQVELNSLELGERALNKRCDDEILRAALKELYPNVHFDGFSNLYSRYKQGEDVGEQGRSMIDAVEAKARSEYNTYDDARPQGLRRRIAEDTGIDIDEVVANKYRDRSEDEQAALQRYLRELFGVKEQEEKQAEPTDAAKRIEGGDDATIQDDTTPPQDGGGIIFGNGSATPPQDIARQEAVDAMNRAYDDAIDTFGENSEQYASALDEDPLSLLDSGTLNAEQEAAVLAFYNARERARRAAADDGPAATAEVVSDIERKAHRRSGVLMPATMRDGREVYVVQGDVVANEDGSINIGESSDFIIVADANTGEISTTSPRFMASRGEAIELQAAIDRALQQQAANQQGGATVNEQSATATTAATNDVPNGDAMPTSQDLPTETTEAEEQMQGQGQSPAPQVVGNEDAAGGEMTALQRIPVGDDGEPVFESVDKETAWDGLVEAVGGEADAAEIALAQVQQAATDLETLKKKAPTPKLSKLKGSPMAMVEAKRRAAEQYQSDLALYNQQLAEMQARLEAWNGIIGVYNSRSAERDRQQREEQRQRDAQAYEEAMARDAERKRIEAEKEAEQAAIGTHAVNPKIKAKWDGIPKIEGNADVITLPDGSQLRGHYILTEAGAASASHDPSNGFAPTEGFPIDVNGQSVNDRDYHRDKDAQRIVKDMAEAYDSRALQSPVVVSQDGIVLSGNNRTMSGDIAARQGTDKAYVDYLREFGAKYGFTREQVGGMRHPRVVFVPEERLSYDAATFSRFNAQEMKSQSKPEAAVKLGKTVPDDVFGQITNIISGYDRLSDFYSDEKAVAYTLGLLLQSNVINDKQMPELRTGAALSAAGKELIENVLIGKVFQGNPDAVRQLIEMPGVKQSVVMGLSEIAANRALAADGYDLTVELANAVDLVMRAKAALPDVFAEGVPVSGFGRQSGMFDDEYGDSSVTDAATLLLADILNSGKPSELRKVLASYNKDAGMAAAGQMDIFSGEIESKETILKRVKEHFKNATTKEQQAIVDAAIAERKRRATEQGEGSPTAGQANNADERSGESRTQTVTPNTVGGDGDRSIEEWFGPVYTQFEGKGKEAEAYLRETNEGVAKGALTYPGVEPIDLVWGDMKAGYMKILIKHPEVVGRLQEILSGTKIVQQSDNRIVFESDTHRMIVSKMKGSTSTDNWLLTAYEKKEKSASASSSDIETEPEGKRNGTATPQNGLVESKLQTAASQPHGLASDDKGNTLSGEKQEDGAKSAENEAQEADGDVDMLRRKWEAMKGKMPDGSVFIVEHNGRYYAFGDDATRVNAALTGKGDAARTDMVSLDEKQYEEALEVLDLKGFSVASYSANDIKDVKQQKVSGGAAELTPQEQALTDGLVGVLRDGGIETIADVEIGQQVIDAANGDVRYDFASSEEEFESRHQMAVEQRGIVAAGLEQESVTVVDVPRHSFIGSFKEAVKAAEAWARANLTGREFTFGKNGGHYSISGKAIRKYLSQSALSPSENIGVHLAALNRLPQIIESSIDVEIHPDYKKGEDAKRTIENGIGRSDVLVHRLYGCINIDGQLYRVKTTIYEYRRTSEQKKNAPHSYEVAKIELLEAPQRSDRQHLAMTSSNSISVAKLLKGIEKSYDKGKKIIDESRKNGVRMHKVYHGSGADFDAFDFSHMGEGEGNQAYGYGGYVTEVEGIGRTYAKAMAKTANQRGKLLWECKTKYVDLRDLKRWHANAEEELAERIKDLEERKQSGRDANEIKRYEYAIKLQQGIVDDYKQRLTEAEAAYDEAVRALNEFDKNNPESSILYTIEVPDDNGRNYLHWESAVGEERARELRERLFEHLIRNDEEGAYEDAASREMLQRELAAISGDVSGADVYGTLSSYLGSDKAASEFLRDNGFVGVSYPAQYKTGGRTDKARNFVIFDEGDMRITDKARFFRTSRGEVYGFTIGGRIYLDPRIATAETPIHEYAHLWAEALRRGNATEWSNVVELMRKTPIWEEVKKKYPELTTDSEIADEVLAHYSGRRGAERLRQEMRKAIDEADGAMNKAIVANVFGKIGRALGKFWRAVADMLHIHYTSAEEVADRVLYDMLRGFNPKDVAGKGDAEISDIVAKAKADGTYMKAPNGKPSKLTEEQWTQVRTKAFKEWFGDWEKAARIEKLRKSQPASIKGKEIEISDDYQQNKRKALEYGKRLQGSYTNADTGATVQLQRGRKNGGINEVLQHNYKDVAHIQSVAAIPQIIEKSIYIASEANRDVSKNPNVKEYQHFVCGLKIGDEDYTVHSLIAVDKSGNRYYDHNLTQIEKTKLLDQINGQAVYEQGFGTTPGITPTTLNDYKGRKLFELLQNNSSQVVDENGEPLVVYHGTTTGGFSVFDNSKGDSQAYHVSDAFFFSSSKTVADGYSIRSFASIDEAQAHIPGDNDLSVDDADLEIRERVERIGRRVKRDYAAFYNGEFVPNSDAKTPEEAIAKAKHTFARHYYTDSSRVYECFVNLTNPYVIDADGYLAWRVERPSIDELKRAGYDGIIIRNTSDNSNFMRAEIADDIVAFYPEQIKSATENVGTFDYTNPDIRYQIVGEKGAASLDKAEDITARVIGDVDAHKIAIEDRVAQRDYLLSDSYASSLTGGEFAKSNTPLTERVAQYYAEKYNGKVEREGLGVVVLDKRGVKDSLSHGIGRNKSAAFAAVPNIIRFGVLIDQKENWKSRNYDSYTIAAPIEIDREGYVCIAIVIRGHGTNINKFYLHEVVPQKNLLNESIKTGTKADSHRGDVANVLKEIVTAKEDAENLSDDVLYRIREDEPPTKTGIGYKVFVLKDGKLYPPMVANPGGEATPIGVWLDADAAPVAGVTKTGRQQVKSGGKGTQGGSGKLAYRPGWHLGEIPYALQFNRINPKSGQRELFPANFVWAEVEYANDVDYQDEAMSYGMNKSGKFQHSLAGLPRLPKDGSYKYRTNPDPNTDDWIITGAMKVNRILKPSEVDAMVEGAGRKPQPRQAGAVTDAQVESLNREIESSMQGDGAASIEALQTSHEARRKAAERLGERLNTKVNIVSDVSEITHPNAAVQARQRRAKGMYDPLTGEVTIVLPNNADVADVENTALHEIVGHDGLRVLFPDKAKLDNALDELYRVSDGSIKATIDATARKLHDAEVARIIERKRLEHQAKGEDANTHRATDMAEAYAEAAKHSEQHRRTATEEYGANLAGRIGKSGFEKMSAEELTFWGKFRAILQKALSSLKRGLGIKSKRPWTDKEWAFVLHEAYKAKLRGNKRPDAMDMADTAIMRRLTGFDEDAGSRRTAERNGESGSANTAADAELLRRQSEREIVNSKIDAAIAIATGKDIKTARQERREREAARKRLAAEIYRKVLAGEINDVTLQQINEYINDSTPRNRYGRPLSQRLPQGVERALYARTPENRIDVLFSRICESGSAANERAGASAGRKRQAVEERKKKALELWAKASGNWHTDLSEFTNSDGFIDHGTDSDVYLSKDGKSVIKLSKGKPFGKRFRPDIDNIALFNYVFPNSAYRILGYGDFGKGCVRILQQPYVDFSKATALSADERTAYMDKLGFQPINDERTAFSNGEIIVSDLQKNNIVKDAAGNITVIDADCKLHTKDIGGKWDYPSTESDLPQRGDAAYDGDGRRDDSDALMYRDGEKSLEETITEMRVAAMQANEGNLQAKREAMRAIGGNLNHLRQAMARQREYDVATAKSVKDLAQILIDNGLLSDMSAIEVKGLLKATADAIGRQDISGQVKRVYDIMLRNHLRNQEADFASLTSMRGSRVDARGIQVQGELDADGQMTLSVFNRAKSLKSNSPDAQGQYSQDSIEWYIGDAMDRMSSDNEQMASAAATEYAALISAKTFIDNVTYHKNAEKQLRQELRKAEQEYKAGLIDKAAFDGIKESIEEAIQQEQMQRIEGYEDVMTQLGGVLGESVERAKAWREAQKEHVRRIQHLANSDMQGREGRGHKTDTRLQKLANNPIVRYILSPMASLDQMLKMFGSKNANGEGYLWNYYMRGIMDSLDNEQLTKEHYYSAMDEATKRIFGKDKFTQLYAIADKGPSMTIKYYDGVAEREYELSQQALMYLYAVDKMPMGRATNRRMGITDEMIAQITQAITPQMRDFIDWVQEELLPELGKAADEVHQRMFGAHMDAIENYFPFVRDNNAIKRQVENGMEARSNTRISLTTGAIKKRVASVAVWDMRNINFLDVLAKHVDEMVHWLSFAEMNRDLSTLQSYNRFHQQVLGMSSMYGAGETLWSNFTKVCAIATDSYEPMRAAADKTAVQVAKGVTMGKISARPFTALKQTLSLPAFFGDVDVRHLSRSMATAGIEAMQWAWKNMPNFRKRILSRTIGDYRLKATEYDTKIMKAATYGMMPNIAVDAWTIAIGAHAKYLTSLNKYLQWGMDKDAAHRRAVQDAELCYNKSQQSSEGGFMAPVQVDHSWLTMVMMLFRNASTAYTREVLNSARNLKRITTGQADIDFMAKQWLRTMGKDEAEWTDADWAQARKVAAQERATAVKRNGINLVMYGWLLPWLWRIGAVAPTLLLLNDSREKDAEAIDTLRSSMFGPIEGLAYGDVAADGLSLIANNAIDGEWSWGDLNKIGRSNPLSSDIAAVVKDMGRDWVVGVNDILNIVGATWTGVNPQTLTDWVAAIMDASDDRDTRNETALLVARLLNCPQSQLQKLYLEELDMNGDEASRLTPVELAERYAAYKAIRETPMTGWMRGADDKNSSADRARKVVLSAAKDKAKALVMTERNKALAEECRTIDAERKAILKTAKTDMNAFNKQWNAFLKRTDMQRFFHVKMLLRSMDDVVKQYVQSRDAEEMRKLESDIKTIRDSLAAEAEKGSIRQ